MNEQLETLEHAKRTVLDLAIQFGPKLLVAVIIVIAGVVVGRWAARIAERAMGKVEIEPIVRQLLSRIVHIFVMALFLVMALQNLGIELLPLIAGVGLAGAGVALAMQGVLGNLVAGFVIIFTRPFRIGEFISIAGVEGEVDAIELFNTTLRHPDCSQVVIPNRKIVGEILHNYGSIRQLAIVVRVAYDTDLNQALAVIDETLQSNARLLKDPAPVIHVSVLANSSVNIAVKPWAAVPDYVAAQGEITKAIVEAFRSRGIVIPLPQREVRMLNG
jgi:small conductance mechanosensitive channel